MENVQVDGTEREPEPFDTQDWWFTFGSGQEFDGRYVVINGTYDSARNVMFEHFGPRWAYQYPSAEAASVDQFGMRLLDESEWRPAATPPAPLVHYDRDTIDLITGCGVRFGDLPPGEDTSYNPSRVTCPACVEKLTNVQPIEHPRDLAPRIGPDPAPVERRTVSLEVLGDEHRAAGMETPPAATVAIVVRTDGRIAAVPEDDSMWTAAYRRPADILSILLRQARMYADGGIDGEGGAELLMPTPAVLSVLAGQPIGAYTASIPLRYGDVRAGWQVLVETVADGRGKFTWLLVEHTVDCPRPRECLVACGDEDYCIVVTIRGRGIQHLERWKPVNVRIPAHTAVES